MNNCVPTRCRLADTGVDRKWLFEQILIWARVVHSCASGSMRSEASWSSHDAHFESGRMFDIHCCTVC
ncbi:hypothetical protein PC116_g19638 [Phytophthora cactorum]|uniref:Uncharacterized protein n=1 Tax=Phytophthora cactorum TaxID=29920 RepID=A0A8T1DZW8_9STRA|nr:hypothetical protein PC111_g22283 [Phytophthora cactorum]KAG2811712.1 hypothetical protein PC112_g15480 [Phytophthora cactorum]KAG2861798.1 hypothetical protein PC113_g6848 [Phytophthora cactorum]KAG2874249.1 hypothetical protein PC114_g25375 [Phytophthora cactorum]KAG2904150.1 hypothetical protein PC115_g15081 [Phytophthora cactorum]